MAACPSTLAPVPLHDTYQDQDDVFISDSDDGLLMLNNDDMDQFAPNSHEASYQPHQQPQSKEEEEEGEEIEVSDNDSVLLSVVDDHHAADGGEDVAIVIDQQPRKSSDPDRSLFQPSQIEEKLLNDRLLAGAEGGAAQLEAQLAVAVRKKATKTAGSSLAAANSESRSPRRRRVSLWNGVVACLTPVMGYFKKEKEPKVKEDEWEIDFADISELNFIGSGAQGAVFAGIYLGEKVAVKKVKDPKYCQEAWNMRKLDHTNIVKMIGLCTKPPCFCVVMEYCGGGTLYDYIHNEEIEVEVLPPQVIAWARQIGAGVQYLHSKKIIHRDLKSMNILLCENDRIKITDFGVSRLIGDKSTRMTFVGTVAWMAPEVIRHEPYWEKVDVWSYGVVIWELLTQQKPYSNVCSSAIIWGVGSNNLHLPLPSSCPIGFKLLMEMCWQPKAKNRPSFRQIMMHLDLAAGAFLAIPPETYLMSQEDWRGEIEQCLSKLRTDGIPDPELIHQREEELRHAQDVRLMYEQRLKTADSLFRQLKSCRNSLEARELQVQRKERQLQDMVIKFKRHSVSGQLPVHLEQALYTDQRFSDTTEEDVDNDTHRPAREHNSPPRYNSGSRIERATSYDVSTPRGRRKTGRKRRRHSNSREEVGPLTADPDIMDSQQALIPQPSSPSHTPPSPTHHPLSPQQQTTPTREFNLDLAVHPTSGESTPRPSQNYESPITAEGEFSPDVAQFLESIKRPGHVLHHGVRRSSSNNSIKTHRRQGSNGSTHSYAMNPSPLSGSPVKGPSQCNSTSSLSKTARRAPTSAHSDRMSSRRGSGNGIQYTRLDSSSSDGGEEEGEHETGTQSSDHNERQPFLSKSKTSTRSQGVEVGDCSTLESRLSGGADVYSNESSGEMRGSDGGHDADGESDGNSLDLLSEIETNESNLESLQSPSNVEESSDINSTTPDALDSDHTHLSNPKCPSPAQNVAMLITQFETSNVNDSEQQPEYPEVPAHLRRDVSVPLAGNYSPKAVEDFLEGAAASVPLGSEGKGRHLGSMTSLVRHYFENITKSPALFMQRSSSSTELEDSGFQSPQAGVPQDDVI